MDAIIKIFADYFGSPCDFGAGEYILERDEDWCAEHCGKVSDAECWRKYVGLKLSEPKGCNNCEWYDDGFCYKDDVCAECASAGVCPAYKSTEEGA